MKKVLITEPLDNRVLNKFQKSCSDISLTVDQYFIKKNPKRQAEIIQNYHGLIIRSQTKISKVLIKKAKRLKVIVSACSGIDNVDQENVKRYHIRHFSSPYGNYKEVVEHILCLLFALSKNLIPANQKLKNNIWCKNEFIAQTIQGKTLGIIGLGKIGNALAEKALCLGLRVLAYDPYVEATKLKNMKFISLNSLFKESDYITICVILNKKTKNLVSRKRLELIKPSSYIINCSRGEIIDEEALYEMCKNKKIKGAGLDVFTNEPNINFKLCRLNNVIATPHIAGTTAESLKYNTIYALEQIINYLR